MASPPSDDLARHAHGVRAFARALCRQESDAQDVAQSTALLALERRASVRGALAGWLRGSARLLAREHYRQETSRAARERAVARPEAVPSTLESAAGLEAAERLVRWLRDLPEEQGEALFLRYWEDLRPREIAARTGVPIATVKTRLKRALRRLRERMAAENRPGDARAILAVAGLPATGAGTGSTAALAGSWTVWIGGTLVTKVVLSVLGLLLVGVAWFAAWGPGTERSGQPTSRHDDGRATTPAPTAPVEPAGGRLAAGPRPAAPAARVLEGVVLDVGGHFADARGAPAAGVEVRLHWGWSIGEDLGTQVTDGRGRFRFDLTDVPHSDLVLFVDGDARLRHADVRVDFPLDRSGVRSCTLRRHPNGGLLGRVRALDGAPLEGVGVEAAGRSGTVRALTDDSGAFLFTRFEPGMELAFTAEGWALLSADRPRQGEGGEWDDVGVVMARTARLAVRVTDASGAPLTDVDVTVRPSRAERAGRRAAWGPQAPTPRASTDARGSASVEDVWAEQKLELEVIRGRQSWRFSAHGPDGPKAGAPLVAEPGELLEVDLRLGARSRVSGRVLDPAGEPAAGAHLSLRSVERGGVPEEELSIHGTADDEGRFAIEFIASEPAGQGHLLATDVEPYRLQQGLVDAPTMASRVLDLATGADGLVLELAPTAAVSGTVTSADGEPVPARVEVLGGRRGAPQERLESGVAGWTIARRDGSFRLGGLLPGTYTLRASHRDFGARDVTDVEAGTSALEVSLSGAPECSLHVEVAAPTGVELGEIIVQRSWLPFPGRDATGAPDLPAQGAYSVPGGYADPWGGSGGFRGYHGPQGRVESFSIPIGGRRATLGARSGLGWVGATGKTIDGVELYPVGTGLVQLTPGEHHLRFELRPTGSLEGRIHRAGGAPLCAAVALPGGGLLELVQNRFADPTIELGARGDFQFDVLPEGGHDLLVGTRAELLRGAPRVTIPVTIVPGETTRVAHDLALGR